MKALIKSYHKPGLWLQDAPLPQFGPDDVLVKVRKTGICGTDMHIFKWDDWARATIPVPMVVGHEFAGEIVELGSHVRNLKIGQRVSGEGHVIGMKSRASRGGRYHLDPETKGIGVNIPGAFAEYLALPAFNVIPLPEEIDDELGAILDPLGNAVHTALSYDLAGEDVLITGAGPIGIMAAAVARHAGARHVVITDINQQRLDLAASVADVTPVNVARNDLRDEMHRLKMQEGFDIGLEISGSGDAFNQMIDHMVMGGKIAILGFLPRSLSIDWTKLCLRMLTIKGIYGREMFETWHKMLGMLQTGLDVRGVITHRLSANQFEDGFAAISRGEAAKVVLDWNNCDGLSGT